MSGVLVTGSSGMLGSNLVWVAVAKGFRTIACYGRNSIEIPGAECVSLNITDPQAVVEVMNRFRPDIVVHCAAETRVDHCERHPEAAFLVNLEGTRFVTRSAADVGATVIYVSTDSVFDGAKGKYGEDQQPHPINVYAETKLKGEDAVREVTENHLILRTNIFGWSAQRRLSLAEWVLNRLEQHQQVPGFTDVVFSPILVNHLADVILEAATRNLRGTFHAGSRDSITKFEFARAIARAFGLDIELVVPALVTQAGFVASRPLDTSLIVNRIAHALGRTIPLVQDGIAEFCRLHGSRHHLRLRSALRVLA